MRGSAALFAFAGESIAHLAASSWNRENQMIMVRALRGSGAHSFYLFSILEDKRKKCGGGCGPGRNQVGAPRERAGKPAVLPYFAPRRAQLRHRFEQGGLLRRGFKKKVGEHPGVNVWRPGRQWKRQ